MEDKTINILGVKYDIEFKKENTDPRLNGCLGYCDDTSKKCVIEDYEHTIEMKENIDVTKKKTIRHEILHAFLFESGLTDKSYDELMVEWFASQFNKISKAFEEAGAI